MTDELRPLILDAVRQVRISLGPNALEIARIGGTIHLTPEEAAGLTDAVMAALAAARQDPPRLVLDAGVVEFPVGTSDETVARWHAAYEALDCEHCATAGHGYSAYARLVAETRFGHDGVAHRLYKGLTSQGIATGEQVAALTDDQVDDLRNSGWRALERVRSRFPAPGAAAEDE